MASIKVKFRPSVVIGHEGTIYYQIIHERRVRQLLSGLHLMQDEWNNRRSAVVINPESDRQSLTMSVREHIRLDVERLTRIIRHLDANGLDYAAEDVIEEFNRYSRELSLFNYMERIIARLKTSKKIRTSETYRATLNSFRKFRNGKDMMLDELSSEIMEAYEAWHKERGNTPNTVSFYTRVLRAVYNRAVDQGIIDDRRPFRHVYTGVDKTEKRALPLRLVKKIKALDLSSYPTLDFAKDMFLMSFYLRGMSFIDMAFLRKSDLKNGHVVYRRRKTGQQLSIEWTKEMQLILGKYPANTSDFLLPIIKRPGINERSAYRNAGYNINRNLKTIASMLDLKFRLTMYVARHSWASAAKAKGIPLSVISECMGHDSETTTQIYLASLDSSVIDRANSLIIKSL